jgi:type III pantothenate kinase
VILCVDIGNSWIKMAVADESGVLGRERFATASVRHEPGGLELAVRRSSAAVLAVRGALACSVVPEVTREVLKCVGDVLGLRPELVTHEMRFPMEIAVPLPSRVGVDRLCTAAGALGGRRRHAIVADAGSAVTVDLVSGGKYLGGTIFAGPDAALEALHARASQLPGIDFEALVDHWPDSFDTTESAMVLGASLGTVGAIREVARYLERHAGSRPPRFLTGGWAGVLAAGLGAGWTVDADLTLRGLHRVAQLNGI